MTGGAGEIVLPQVIIDAGPGGSGEGWASGSRQRSSPSSTACSWRRWRSAIRAARHRPAPRPRDGGSVPGVPRASLRALAAWAACRDICAGVGVARPFPSTLTNAGEPGELGRAGAVRTDRADPRRLRRGAAPRGLHVSWPPSSAPAVGRFLSGPRTCRTGGRSSAAPGCGPALQRTGPQAHRTSVATTSGPHRQRPRPQRRRPAYQWSIRPGNSGYAAACHTCEYGDCWATTRTEVLAMLQAWALDFA